MIVMPDDDTLLSSVDKSLATTLPSETGPSSDAGQAPTDIDHVIPKSSAKSPSSPSREETATGESQPNIIFIKIFQ